MIKRIFIAVSTVALLLSCNGNGAGNDEKGPTIVLEEGAIVDNTISFFATVSDASAAAYLCVPESAETPTAEKILSTGSSVKVGEKVELTAYNLQYNTTYQIVVAAMTETGKVSTETLIMTTGEQPTHIVIEAMATTRNTFKFSITSQNSESVYYKVYAQGSTATDADIESTGTSVPANEVIEETVELEKGNYFVAAVAKKGDRIVRAKDVTFSIAGAELVNVEVKRVEAKDYGSDVLFDIYLQNSDVNVIKIDCYYHEGTKSMYGDYVYSNKAESGKVAHSYSYSSLLSSNRVFFKSGTVSVQQAANSQVTLIVKMTREDDKAYDFTWTGPVQWK